MDANGVTTYGLQPDYSELDDEWACTTTPWDSYGCPSQPVTAATTGDLLILVGQWGGGCADNSAYTLYTAVNGTNATPTLVQDDTPLQ